MLNWYRELIRLRQTHVALQSLDKQNIQVETFGQTVSMLRQNGQTQLLVLMNFGNQPIDLQLPSGDWQAILNSSQSQWQEKETNVISKDANILPASGVLVLEKKLIFRKISITAEYTEWRRDRMRFSLRSSAFSAVTLFYIRNPISDIRYPSMP